MSAEESQASEDRGGLVLELLGLALTSLLAVGLGSLGGSGLWLAVVAGGVLSLACGVGLALQKRVPVALASASLAMPVLAAARCVHVGVDGVLKTPTDVGPVYAAVAESLNVTLPLAVAGGFGLLLLLGAAVGGLRSRASWKRPAAGGAILAGVLVVALGFFAAFGEELGPQPLILAAGSLLFGVPGLAALAGGAPDGNHAAASGGLVAAFGLGLIALVPSLMGRVATWEAVASAPDDLHLTLLVAGDSLVHMNGMLFWLTFGLAGLFATSGLSSVRAHRALAALGLLGLPLLYSASDALTAVVQTEVVLPAPPDLKLPSLDSGHEPPPMDAIDLDGLDTATPDR